MRALLDLLVLLIPLGLGYAAGVWRARASGLNRRERAELKDLRNLRYWLVRKTGEHQALGDDFATIVGERLDELFSKGIDS